MEVLTEEIIEEVRKIEKKIQLPDGFFDALLSEDDWSFVIKAHALLEAICSELLIELLGNTSFSKVVYRMELSNKYTGKMAFLEACDILNKEERSFIVSMSTLRNELVHHIKNTRFSFREYIGSLDSNSKKNFIEAMGYVFHSDESGKVEGTDREYVLKEPKKTVWLSLQFIAAIVSLQIDIIVYNRQANEYKAQRDELLNQMNTIKGLVQK